MFSNKKGRMVRHPYLALAVIGLATAGAVSISDKVKHLFKGKAKCVSNMVNGIKDNNM